MAMQWRRVAQRKFFVGRAGDVGDEVGSALGAAAIARDLMRLCFLVERRYPPTRSGPGQPSPGSPVARRSARS